MALWVNAKFRCKDKKLAALIRRRVNVELKIRGSR